MDIRNQWPLVLLLSAATLCSCRQVAAEAPPCASLTRLALPNTTIASAETVAAAAFRPPPPSGARSVEFFTAFSRLPSFCRVQAIVAPSRDSHITVEVWLPTSGWNGRYLGVGNGGFGGSLSYARLGEAVNSGYVGASTDTGHEGGQRDSSWSVGHPEKQTDFDYRAVHEMTALAKSAIVAFYGKGPDRSYFSSCSNGGRQGLMEAERYPADYDGIMAGAPAYHFGFTTFVSGTLDAFRDRGGKLMIYHGGADNPEGSVSYYRRLASQMGRDRVDGFVQLYVVPGMGHCGSGLVPNDFGQWVRPGADAQHSMLKALEQWVESGIAPKSVIATQWRIDGDTASGVLRTRPLCPYPEDATWTGAGSPDDAANYSCRDVDSRVSSTITKRSPSGATSYLALGIWGPSRYGARNSTLGARTAGGASPGEASSRDGGGAVLTFWRGTRALPRCGSTSVWIRGGASLPTRPASHACRFV